MPTSAMYFQSVLDVVKTWYEQGFYDLRVNGQLALEGDDRSLVHYCAKYISKSPELQLRGLLHLHYVVIRRRNAQ